MNVGDRGSGIISDGLNAERAYKNTFGYLENKSILHEGIFGPILPPGEARKYMSPNMKFMADIISENVKIVQQKTTMTTSGGAGTAGYGLIPIYVDPIITDASRKYTPLREMFPRVTNQGMTADYNVLTAKGSAFSAVEDAPLGDVADTEGRSTVPIKFFYSIGRVTGPSRAAQPGYTLAGWQASGTGLAGSTFGNAAAPNAQQYEIAKRARALMEYEESTIVNGDASTTATDFSGIVKLQGTTNRKNKGTTALEYGDIEDVMQYAIDDSGRPNLAICPTSVLSDLRKIMIETFHYRPMDMAGQALPFGVSSHLTLETSIGPVPVFFSQYLSNTTGSKALYFLDMNAIEIRVLQDMTYEDMAHVNDSDKFMLKIYEAMIFRNNNFNSFVGAIA